MQNRKTTEIWAKKWKKEFEKIRKRYNKYFQKNNITIILVSDEREEENYE